MFQKIKFGLFVLVLAAFFGGAAFVIAQKATPDTKKQNALGEEDVKQLPALMDTDKNGKISKHEYMKFMEAEFDRLDKDKSGELDAKELTQSQVRASRLAVGK
jgi:Ca2+-binding EF-hand superfamily protein